MSDYIPRQLLPLWVKEQEYVWNSRRSSWADISALTLDLPLMLLPKEILNAHVFDFAREAHWNYWRVRVEGYFDREDIKKILAAPGGLANLERRAFSSELPPSDFLVPGNYPQDVLQRMKENYIKIVVYLLETDSEFLQESLIDDVVQVNQIMERIQKGQDISHYVLPLIDFSTDPRAADMIEALYVKLHLGELRPVPGVPANLIKLGSFWNGASWSRARFNLRNQKVEGGWNLIHMIDGLGERLDHPGLDDRTRIVPRLGIPDDAVINSLRKKSAELVVALDGVFAERRRMFHGIHVQPPEGEVRANYEALLNSKPIAKAVLCQVPTATSGVSIQGKPVLSQAPAPVSGVFCQGKPVAGIVIHHDNCAQEDTTTESDNEENSGEEDNTDGATREYFEEHNIKEEPLDVEDSESDTDTPADIEPEKSKDSGSSQRKRSPEPVVPEPGEPGEKRSPTASQAEADSSMVEFGVNVATVLASLTTSTATTDTLQTRATPGPSSGVWRPSDMSSQAKQMFPLMPEAVNKDYKAHVLNSDKIKYISEAAPVVVAVPIRNMVADPGKFGPQIERAAKVITEYLADKDRRRPDLRDRITKMLEDQRQGEPFVMGGAVADSVIKCWTKTLTPLRTEIHGGVPVVGIDTETEMSVLIPGQHFHVSFPQGPLCHRLLKDELRKDLVAIFRDIATWIEEGRNPASVSSVLSILFARLFPIAQGWNKDNPDTEVFF